MVPGGMRNVPVCCMIKSKRSIHARAAKHTHECIIFNRITSPDIDLFEIFFVFFMLMSSADGRDFLRSCSLFPTAEAVSSRALSLTDQEVFKIKVS